MVYNTLQHYLPKIKKLPTNRVLIKSDLVKKDFLMESEEKIKMYYAPHNEYINIQAKIVIVGITPGFNQMKIAYEQFLKSLATGHNLETCLYHSKWAARFAGPMRTNLIDMLNQCNVPQVLGLKEASHLFEKTSTLLHTTSVIKYPVFVKDKNYTGHQPDLHRSNLLHHYAFNEFPKELGQISTPALIIPLGKTVEQVILELIVENKLPNHYYLTGFPHPSGANGHRVKQLQQQKTQLQDKVKSWEKNIK